MPSTFGSKYGFISSKDCDKRSLRALVPVLSGVINDAFLRLCFITGFGSKTSERTLGKTAFYSFYNSDSVSFNSRMSAFRGHFCV